MSEEPVTRQGACVCGAVRMRARARSAIGVCHCSICRQWGGGPLFAVECEGDVRFEGDEHISVYSSSAWAERGFCARCGTHLFYRLKEETHYALPLWLFGEGEDWRFEEQIFVDEKPAFYSFSEQTATLTGEEVFARYTGD